MPKPAHGAREVLVRVVVAGINPIRWKIRSGAVAAFFPVQPPATLGWDAAGVVTAVGAEVGGFKAGDAVFFFADFAHGGTYAEYVAVDAAQVALKPRTVSLAGAAAIPAPALAAWRAVVDIASDASIAIARATGADEVVNYRHQAFETLVRDADVVIDTVGGPVQQASWGTLKRGGILVATAMPPSAERAAAAGVRAEMLRTPPDGKVLARIAELVDAGRLRVAVSHEFALAEAARAHRLGESGQARGKIVLHIGQPG